MPFYRKAVLYCFAAILHGNNEESMNEKELKKLARAIAADILQSALKANVLQISDKLRDMGLSEEERHVIEQTIYDIIMLLRQQ